MEQDLMDEVLMQICQIAKEYHVKKMILFGSRARGDHSSLSDYDIAVCDTGLSEGDKAGFSLEMEDVQTLKKIDIVFVNDEQGDELMKNIMRDGVIIYDQTEK